MRVRTNTLVVGAGAAGVFCALGAARHGSVILLDAGPDPGDPPPPWSLHDYVLPDAHYDHYVDADSGKPLPQGRGLGGGSTVNSAAALRGQPWCYDGWDVPNWGWDDCLAAFCAIESDHQFGDRRYHGSDGPIPITRLSPGGLDTAVFDWCAANGFGEIDDHNAPGALGYGMWSTNRRDGARWGTYAGVVPAARAHGVDIRAGTTATRLLFDGQRCVGAETTGAGGRQHLLADHVVLCAGAFGTPALLIRSGIGPHDVLSQLGVPPLSVLGQVGRNLQDHPWCLLDVDVADQAAIDARPVSGALLRYELDGTPDEHVEAEIFPWQVRPYDATAPATRVAFTAALMTPRSRGTFTLSRHGPRVRVNHLGERVDAHRMASIVTTTADMIDALVASGAVVAPNDPWWRQKDLVDACRRTVGTYNHHCGTCRLGNPAELDCVVGPDLRVLGTEGLWIADSSVIPVIPRANTTLVSMMIGLRAPQFIF